MARLKKVQKVEPAQQSMAVPNWSELLEKGKPPLPPISQIPGYSKEAEELGWALFSTLIFPTPESTRPYAETCPKWMEQVARWIFGCENVETGHRLVNEICLTVAKKNGKTTFFSLVLLTFWIKSKRDDAEALIMAPTKETANIAFANIEKVIRATPYYNKMYGFVPSQRKIVCPGNKKVLKIVAADTDSVVGITASYVYIDELHQIAKSAKARELMPHVRGARSSKLEAVTFVTSTHAHKIGNEVWESMVELGRSIRDGEYESELGDTFVYIGYEWTKDELESKAYENPDTWHKANPSLDTIVRPREDILREAGYRKQDAKDWADFCNQFLNVEPGVWRGDASWVGAMWWDDCYFEPISAQGIKGLYALLDRCDTVVAGIDGGSIKDWLALVLLGVDRNTGAWLAWPHAWAHERYITAHPEYGARCRSFEKKDELTIVPDLGNPIIGETRASIDLDQMVDILCLCNERGKFPKVAAIGIDGVAGVDYENRIIRENVVDMYAPTPQQIGRTGQGAWLHEAIVGLPGRMEKGQFGHNGSRAMAWCVANAQIARNTTGRYHITRDEKPASASASNQKTDLFIALMNAVFVMLKHQHDDLNTEQVVAGDVPAVYA